ncbi:RNA polymerase sigma factor [Paenibacillus sp. sgz500992]|uniref:RNA polymerase sigma factor n=1 Tax=Paenibacillus sp. sgz500992 TaxID=3242476 RepID=UPI0036D31327
MHSEKLSYTMACTPSMTLREMMESYGSDVWHYAFFLTGSREQADDISQEVFLKAYRNIGKYRGRSTLR